MDKTIKSGKELLDNFFAGISKIKKVDKALADTLSTLYRQGKLTDTNVKTELQRLRDKNANKS